GTRTMRLQDAAGQVLPTHSVSAGLDYPAVGPEHAQLKDSRRVTYARASDEAALDAFEVLSRTEGIVPALESDHAVAFALELAQKMTKKAWILINLSGRWDKDMGAYERIRGAATG